MYGINDAGQTVGTAFSGKASFAFVYDGTNSNLIPPPAGWTQSAAFGINNSGYMVGFVDNGSANATQSFLYNGSISTVIQSPTGSTYSEAEGINDSGEVVGFGYGGNTQAFVNNGSLSSLSMEGLKTAASQLLDR